MASGDIDQHFANSFLSMASKIFYVASDLAFKLQSELKKSKDDASNENDCGQLTTAKPDLWELYDQRVREKYGEAAALEHVKAKRVLRPHTRLLDALIQHLHKIEWGRLHEEPAKFEAVRSELETIARLTEPYLGPLRMKPWTISMLERLTKSLQEASKAGHSAVEKERETYPYFNPWDKPAGANFGKGATLQERLGKPPTRIQLAIWRALENRALKTTDLAQKVTNGDHSQLYYMNKKKRRVASRNYRISA